MTITVNGHAAEIGCYVAGHWGQYGPDHMADLAESFGWSASDPSDDPRHWRDVAEHNALDYDAECDAWQSHHDAADDVERWLNDHTDGGYWHWQDGEFFLSTKRAPMTMRTAHFTGALVAKCEECGSVCAYWDDDDLEDGVLYCYHEEDY